MTNNTQLVLHVGAHRTGSTSLQWRLDALSDALRRNGIVALTPPREGKRGSPTLRDATKVRISTNGLWRKPRQRAALRAARVLLADRISSEVGSTRVRRLILSDEVMLGPPFGPGGESVYPEADRKLATLQRILPQKPTEVHLVLRSYDSFLRSAYAMLAVYTDGVASFEKIQSRLITVDHGWPDLVEALRRRFPSAHLILSTLEKTNAEVILEKLCDLPVALLGASTPPPRHLNHAPTMAAIEAARGQPKSSYNPDLLVKPHKDGDVFDPFSPDEKATLAARYARDCAEIAARHDVEWIPSDVGLRPS